MRNESSLNEKSFTDLPRVFLPEKETLPAVPHRNLLTELKSLREVPFAIIEHGLFSLFLSASPEIQQVPLLSRAIAPEKENTRLYTESIVGDKIFGLFVLWHLS